MALIKCPKCGNTVSDKSANCHFCGEPLQAIQSHEPSSDSNSEEGTALHPTTTEPSMGQVHQNNRGLKILVGVLTALLLGAIAFFGYLQYSNSQRQSDIRKEAEQKRLDSIAVALDEKKANIEKIAEQKADSIVQKRESETSPQKTHVETHAESPSAASTVVINGVHVRLRTSPQITAYNILLYENGKPVYLPKGTALTYLGENGDFYVANFRGYTVYISKQYSYLQ